MQKRNLRRGLQSACAITVMEMLQPRMLLSATIVSGVLKVMGSESADHITVLADATYLNVIDVSLNGAVTYFAAGDIQKLLVRPLGGDDVVRIDSSLDALELSSSIDGGAGDDTLMGGGGRDTLVGGEGND